MILSRGRRKNDMEILKEMPLEQKRCEIYRRLSALCGGMGAGGKSPEEILDTIGNIATDPWAKIVADAFVKLYTESKEAAFKYIDEEVKNLHQKGVT
jgi:hypothetical protein